MHNWFAMETEAEFRHHEWQRQAAKNARSAQVCAEPSRPRDIRLPRLALSRLKRLIMPRPAPALPLASGYQDAPC